MMEKPGKHGFKNSEHIGMIEIDPNSLIKFMSQLMALYGKKVEKRLYFTKRWGKRMESYVKQIKTLE